MVFDPRLKYYFTDPGRFGQDVSGASDLDEDDLVDADGNPIDADDVPVETNTPDPSALERINDRIANARDTYDQAKDVRDKLRKKQTGSASSEPPVPGQPSPNPTLDARTSLGVGEPSVAQDITQATRQKAGQQAAKASSEVAKKAVQQGAKQAIQKGATQATAAAVEAGAQLLDAAGPVGIAAAAAITVLVEFSKTKAFKYLLIGSLALSIGFFLLVGAGFLALTNSGLQGSRDLIQLVAGAAFGPITLGQSLTAFVLNIDTITKDIDALLKNNPQLEPKASEIQGLLSQLRDMRNQIEPTSGGDGQATAEQLQKYNAVVLQIKQLVEADRQTTSALVQAAHDNNTLRLETSVCNTAKDIKNLSMTTSALKVMLAAADYGRSQGKTIQVTCLVSGHRKYVGLSPRAGYPYCGQPDNALSSNVSPNRQSRHCSGRAIDFGGTDPGLANYLKSRKQELNIEDVLIESATNHIHVEVTK